MQTFTLTGQELFNSFPEPVFWTCLGRLTYWNHAAERLCREAGTPLEADGELPAPLRLLDGGEAQAADLRLAGQAFHGLGQPLSELDREECIRRLSAAVDRVYPLVAPAGVPRPVLKVRKMKSRWGSCLYRKGTITLNSALAACPEELQDYVALHELCHFLHPDHSPAFHRAMSARMPDWKARRRQLTQYRLD